MKVELKYRHLVSGITTTEVWQDERSDILKIKVRGRLRFLGYSEQPLDNVIKVKSIIECETHHKIRNWKGWMNNVL